jgi:hypothetical protein
MRKWVTATLGSRQRGTVDRDRVRIEAGRNPADAVAHARHRVASSTCARLPVRGPRIASKAGPKTQLGVAAKARHVDEQLRAVEPNGNRVASQVRLGAGGGVARRRKPDGQYVHLESRRDEYADDERASAKGRIRGKHSCPSPESGRASIPRQHKRPPARQRLRLFHRGFTITYTRVGG